MCFRIFATLAGYVAKLVHAGAEACELLVSDVMKRSVGQFEQAPAEWADIDGQTCEMGLEMVAEKPFESIATLLERASRPRATVI